MNSDDENESQGFASSRESLFSSTLSNIQIVGVEDVEGKKLSLGEQTADDDDQLELFVITEPTPTNQVENESDILIEAQDDEDEVVHEEAEPSDFEEVPETLGELDEVGTIQELAGVHTYQIQPQIEYEVKPQLEFLQEEKPQICPPLENSFPDYVVCKPEEVMNGLETWSESLPVTDIPELKADPKGDGVDDSDDCSDSDDDVDDLGIGNDSNLLYGMYDPSDYEHLKVKADVQELFHLIVKYTPQPVELETRFKPFIPDYVPSIGDIDAFIKVKRPDGKSESLGLKVLDEPAVGQSDPSVLDLQLRMLSKQTVKKAAVIKKLDPRKSPNSSEVEQWINSILDLHRSKPFPTVHYPKPMPALDYQMQEWPNEFSRAIERHTPLEGFDCDLTTMVDIVCGLADIPVYKSRIHSLHALFSVYAEFKNSPLFRSITVQSSQKNVESEEDESLLKYLTRFSKQNNTNLEF